MPNFPTVQAAQQWCEQRFPMTQVHHWYDPNWWKIGFWAAVAAAIYLVVRIGLPTLWTDIKSSGSSLVSGIKSVTSPSTATSATTTASV